MELKAQSCGSVKRRSQVFSEYAPALHQAGMATLPLGAKDPLVAGFNKWKRRPGNVVFEKWRAKFPDANVGYVPGLTGKGGTIVLDDDGGARGKLIEMFGNTPGEVGTRRGSHLLYRAPKDYDGQRINLKAFGINADWKSGNDIVVGPGSIHDTGHVYRWRGCDERVIRDLPVIDLSRVRELLRSKTASAGTQDELKAKAGYRSGSAKLQLNDLIYGRSRITADRNELLAVAHQWNRTNETLGIILLKDTEIMQIVDTVLKGREARPVENWHGRRATVRSDLSEVTELASLGKDGTSAFMLLMKLRGEHGARMQRDETFSLNCVAMAKAGTIPNWTRYDYEKARNALLLAGKIEIAAAFSNTKDGRQAGRFCLTPFRAE